MMGLVYGLGFANLENDGMILGQIKVCDRRAVCCKFETDLVLIGRLFWVTVRKTMGTSVK